MDVRLICLPEIRKKQDAFLVGSYLWSLWWIENITSHYLSIGVIYLSTYIYSYIQVIHLPIYFIYVSISSGLSINMHYLSTYLHYLSTYLHYLSTYICYLFIYLLSCYLFINLFYLLTYVCYRFSYLLYVPLYYLSIYPYYLSIYLHYLSA